MSPAGALQHPAAPSERTVTHRSRGSHFRYIRPDDLVQVVKPFVYFDLFDKDGPEMMFGLHPHSGIATIWKLSWWVIEASSARSPKTESRPCVNRGGSGLVPEAGIEPA